MKKLFIVGTGPGDAGGDAEPQDLVTINTEDDSTLLFDFLPMDLGQVEGFKIRVRGFTVPGQPKYRRMRKYVLSGADAVVFVVDSEASRLEENRQSFESLRENLAGNGLDESSIPIVLQYNKRDLSDVLSIEELNADLNPEGAGQNNRQPDFTLGITGTDANIYRIFTGF